ncbi:MAG: translocation/assembly module TamB domain-containing protein, partial [Myxococcota bacterium]
SWQRLRELGLEVPEDVDGPVLLVATAENKGGTPKAFAKVSTAMSSEFGQAAIELDVEATPERCDLVAEVSASGAFGRTLDGDLSVTVDPANTDLTLAIRDRDRELGRVEAVIDRGMSHLGDPALDTMKTGATARAFDLPLREFLPPGLRKRSAGLVNADVRAEGEGRRFVGGGVVSLNGVIIDSTVFDRARLAFDATPEQAQVDLSVRSDGGGVLDVEAEHALTTGDTRVAVDAANFSLAWVPALSRALGVEQWVNGRLDSDLQVALVSETLDVDGTVALSGGSARLVALLPEVEDFEVFGEFSRQNSRLQVSGKPGDGALALELERAGLLKGRFGGKLTLEQVPTTVERVVAETSMTMRVSGKQTLERAALAAVIEEGNIRLLSLEERTLHPTSLPTEIEFVEDQSDDAKLRSVKAPFAVAFSVKTESPITLDGESVNASIDVDVEGTAAESISLAGEVTVPRGEAKVGPHRYDIERARIAFSNSVPIDPRFDISLLHRFDDTGTDFYIRVRGTASEPRLAFSSNPALYDQRELLGFFLGGRPGDTGGEIGASSAVSVVGGLVASRLKGELERVVPVDTIDIDVDGESGSTSLTTGKWIGRDLFVAYTVSVNALASETGSGTTALAPSHVGLLRYRLTPRWTLELKVQPGDQTSGSADIVWVRQF